MPEVYAANFDLAPKTDADPQDAIAAALREWVRVRCPEISEMDFTEPATLRTANGNIIRWEPYLRKDRHLLDFTWRHFDSRSRSVSWSTRVAYLAAKNRPTLSIQVANTGPSVQQPAAMLTSRPRLLVHLLDHFVLRHDGVVCSLQPSMLRTDAIPSFVHYELFDPARALPILVLTPDDDGQFLMEPRQLAEEFLSLGKICVMESPESTFSLTHELHDRRLSCFGGALRAYMPGFGADVDPFKHPLFLPRRLRHNSERLKLANSLALFTTRRYERDPLLLELRDERAIEYEERYRRLAADLQARKAEARDAAEWESFAEEAMQQNTKLADEVEDVRDRLRTAEARIEWLESERRRLLYVLRSQGTEPSHEGAEGDDVALDNVADAVEAAAELYRDHLLILPEAYDTAKASPYRCPRKVATALRALAEISDAARSGVLGMGLREAFRQRGLDYRNGISETTPKKMRRQYEFRDGGVVYRCEEHVCLGGGTYDPAECLRIYFTSKQKSEQRFVVGHIGRHLDGPSTT